MMEGRGSSTPQVTPQVQNVANAFGGTVQPQGAVGTGPNGEVRVEDISF